MSSVLQVSKLDAAKRQLETCIRLYFSSSDPVSVHTLVAAAYNVLRDLSTARAKERMLVKDRMLEWVKPEGVALVRKKLNEAENFFKHADRDHDETLEFNALQSEWLIFDAISQYWTLTGEYPPLHKVFRSWFIAHRPDTFNFPPEQAAVLAKSGPEIRGLGRADFFAQMLPIVHAMQI